MISHNVVYRDRDLIVTKIAIDIPIKALKKVNTYLIESGGESLLIDTGMGVESLRNYINKYFGGVDKVFVTHFHIDHIGGAPEFLRDNIEVFMSNGDIRDILLLKNDPDKYISHIKRIYLESGVPHDLVETMFAKHPGWWRLVDFPYLENIIGLDEGDTLEIGGIEARIILTPGHTPHHACLMIEDKGIIFVGDHILEDITPNIPLIRWDTNPLKDYLLSLNKVLKLKPNIAFPGHRSIIDNVSTRVSELIRHHEARLDEVLNILRRGAQTAYQIASKMTWDVKFREWDEFPPSQKYFAIAEALSHLKYLSEEGRVSREYRDGVYYYKLSEGY